MYDDIALPRGFVAYPDNLNELAIDLGLTPEATHRIFDECAIKDTDGYERVHISSFHEAAPGGDDEERLRVALAALRDFRGKDISELVDQDEPTGELQLADICRKHGLNRDVFIGDITWYGLLHLACPECKATELWQVQRDRITGDELYHPLQIAYWDALDDELMFEYIVGDIGEDEDPPEVGIECMNCHHLGYRGDLIVSPLALESLARLRDEAGTLTDEGPG